MVVDLLSEPKDESGAVGNDADLGAEDVAVSPPLTGGSMGSGVATTAGTEVDISSPIIPA